MDALGTFSAIIYERDIVYDVCVCVCVCVCFVCFVFVFFFCLFFMFYFLHTMPFLWKVVFSKRNNFRGANYFLFFFVFFFFVCFFCTPCPFWKGSSLKGTIFGSKLFSFFFFFFFFCTPFHFLFIFFFFCTPFWIGVISKRNTLESKLFPFKVDPFSEGLLNKFDNVHYENPPIQIYRKFHHQKLKVLR